MKYIIILMSIICLCSCQDFLDETPKGKLIPKTTDDYGMMLDNYYYPNCIGFGQSLTIMMSDDFIIPEDKTFKYQYWGIQSYIWDDYIFGINDEDECYCNFYRAIYTCNYILDNIDKAEEGTTFSRAYVEGSARFHRAYAYFTLVNVYAKHYDKATATTDLGVPLILEADPNIIASRATVQQVYDQVLNDLILAAQLLPQGKQEYSFRANQAAVYALLARVYLYQGEYNKCKESAKIARTQVDEPSDYNQYSVEMGNPDFGIEGYSWSGWEELDIICYKGVGFGPNEDQDYNLSKDLIALFNQETDLRWRLFITSYPLFEDENPNADTPRTAFTLRNNKGPNIGELYIMEAEACVRENDIDNALQLLNTLGRNRHITGTYVDVTERDPEKLLRLILDERRRECFYKGLRWFDLKRLNKDSRFAKTIIHEFEGETYILTPDDKHYVVAFPGIAISTNPQIIQNPR